MIKLIVYCTLLFSINLIAQDTITKPQHSVISLDKVKVVYRGIDNPITVAVLNAKSYTVSGAGVIATNEVGKYLIKAQGGLETKVYVEIILNSDKKIIEEHIFQNKDLPSLITTVNNQFSTQGYLEFTLEELKEAEIGIKLIDFLFPQYPKVDCFTVTINGKEFYENQGNILTEDGLNFIEKARKNDLIILRNIKWYFSGVSASNKPSSSIVLKIIK
jgi:hypothetical protein